MTIRNQEIADYFLEYADKLETRNDNPFRVRAYRRAAYQIMKLTKELESLLKDGYDLLKISGIGKVMASQILNIIKTQKLSIPKSKPKSSQEFRHLRKIVPFRPLSQKCRVTISSLIRHR